MDPMAGSGALEELGIQPLPVGTPEELLAVGLDPSDVASCHPESRGVTRGCALWNDCRFNLPRMGAFKGKTGPKYVGFFQETHEGRRREDFMTCHCFVRTMQARMDTGNQEKMKGRPHETIRIIAQEGEKIVRKIAVKVNPKDTTPNAAYHYLTEVIEVPRFPRPGENPQVTYDQQLVARELERQKSEDAIENAMWNASRETLTTTSEPFEIEEAEVEMPAPGDAPLAEPVPVRKK